MIDTNNNRAIGLVRRTLTTAAIAGALLIAGCDVGWLGAPSWDIWGGGNRARARYVPPPAPDCHEPARDSQRNRAVAWSLLEKGEARRALRRFEAEADRGPEDGALMVGLALSAGASGDRWGAITEMRRAWSTRALDVAALRLGPRALKVVRALRSEFERSSARHRDDPDLGFMIASLRYLEADYWGARLSLGPAPEGGWRSGGDAWLDSMIERRVGGRVTPPKEKRAPLARRTNGPKPADTPENRRSAPAADDASPRDPAPEPPEAVASSAPRQEVDYDLIRERLLRASDSLGSFTEKLADRLGEGKAGGQ